MSSSDRAPVVVAVVDEHDTALRYAATEAVRDRRPLRVVHVVPPVRGVSSMQTMLVAFEAVELVAEDLIRSQYERAQELVGDAVPVERVLRRGAVVEMLLEQARDADHLVVQRRQASRLGRILTGSTVASLAARAPVRVVSVPETWTGRRAEPHVTVALGAVMSRATKSRCWRGRSPRPRPGRHPSTCCTPGTCRPRTAS